MTKKINSSLIAACMLSSALIPLNSTMLAAAMPTIQQAFGLHVGYITFWLVDLYLLINVVFQTLSGRLGDIYGRIKILNFAHLLLFMGVILSIMKLNFSILDNRSIRL